MCQHVVYLNNNNITCWKKKAVTVPTASSPKQDLDVLQTLYTAGKTALPPNTFIIFALFDRLETSTMDDVHLRCLQDRHIFLLKNLQVKDLIDYLYQKRVISFQMMEEIETEKQRADQAKALLRKLPTRGPEAFEGFIYALECSNQEFIAKDLKNTVRQLTGESPGWWPNNT